MDKKRETVKTKDFIKFLSTGRTPDEISSHFGIELSRVKKRLRDVDKIEGFNLFQHRNESSAKIFSVTSEIPKLEVKPKIWQFRRHVTKPYMWIQFPDHFDFKKIKVVPLSDIHYGEKGHKLDLLRRHVEWGAKTENAFFFINGDLTGNAVKNSAGNSIFQQLMSPREQIRGLIKELRPIAHKILWSVPGGHEFRTLVQTDLDPSEWICRELDIPYFSGPVYIDILWKGYTFTFYARHGTKTPQTEGGKLNKAIKPMKTQEFVMFVITGHFHDATANKETRICRERKFDKSGKLISFRLAKKKQYVVVCPAFYGYWGTYAYHGGFDPAVAGNITCELYPNGDYHATKKG